MNRQCVEVLEIMHVKMFGWQKQLFSVHLLVAVILVGSFNYLRCRNREKSVFLVHVYSMQQSASESVKGNTRVDVSKVFEEQIKRGKFRTWVEVEKALKLFENVKIPSVCLLSF
uniref:Uncharacterized protein n=1 Tax=Trichobilharzia regenti TaxID=157069 RepID=A0AA85ISZ8_TRIRE|nr:unnamed protein product [Trichobilharzia regenti]